MIASPQPRKYRPTSSEAWKTTAPLRGTSARVQSTPRQGPPSETVGALAHDASNLMAALGFYCELLSQPGVLTPRYLSYATQLKGVVESGATLVKRIAAQPNSDTGSTAPKASAGGRASRLESRLVKGLFRSLRLQGQSSLSSERDPASATVSLPSSSPESLIDLGGEIERRKDMLAVILGPRVHLEVECLPYPGGVALDAEDLGRILVNLVRNAGEAMPQGGRVRITVQRGDGWSFGLEHAEAPADCKTVLVCVQDTGPGIAPQHLARIFEDGFTTRSALHSGSAGKMPQRVLEMTRQVMPGETPGIDADASRQTRRGRGLGIVRRLVEAAGGSIRVVSSGTVLGPGTRFELLFPLGPGRARPGPRVAG